MMTAHAGGFNNAIELPSLEEIAAMEKQREDVINSLEISGNSVRCQGCEMFDSSLA
jgi:hypothetical protein